jgi:hypothetical protein
MEAARPPRRRRRPRRGTVDRPVDTRLVRVAAVLVAVSALALLFSIAAPGALPRPPLEPAFDGTAASALATQLSTEFPARVPGSAEAEAAAHWYEETMSSLGFATEVVSWRETLPDLGEVELRNLVTVVPGRSDETIVVVAHRDNAGAASPASDNASGTAALIELARAYAPRGAARAPQPDRTLVLLSTDGGAFGGAGAARFVRESELARDALAAIVLDALGGRGRLHLAVAGDGAASPARALVASAVARIREQAGVEPDLQSPLTQLVDLALPYAAGEQGPFLGRGVAAIAISGGEETAVLLGDPGSSAARRLGRLGRAAEALVSSLDASVGPGFRTADTLFLDGRAASGWAVRLTLVVAVVPFFLGALDLLVRARRRRLPLAPALRALRARVLVWLFAGALLWLAQLTGALPTGAALPLPTHSSFLVDRPLTALVTLAAAFAVAWLLARRRLAPIVPATPEERLAGYAVALAWLALVAVAAALTKPYALVFLLPSLYAWLWLPLRTGAGARAALYAAGLGGPLVGLLAFANELGLGPLDTLLYLLGLATVGYVSVAGVLLFLAWAASAAQLAALAFGRYGPYAGGLEPPPRGLLRQSIRELAALRRSRQTSGR